MARIEPDEKVPGEVLSALEKGIAVSRVGGASVRDVLDDLERRGYVLARVQYMDVLFDAINELYSKVDALSRGSQQEGIAEALRLKFIDAGIPVEEFKPALNRFKKARRLRVRR